GCTKDVAFMSHGSVAILDSTIGQSSSYRPDIAARVGVDTTASARAIQNPRVASSGARAFVSPGRTPRRRLHIAWLHPASTSHSVAPKSLVSETPNRQK